jgi:general secretion pathway protein E
VLSTLHTNTAVGAVTRLHDIGIEPFLLSSSLIGVLAQRLVRVLCPACKKPYEPDPRERELLHLPEDSNAVIHRPMGCGECKGSGYHGRTGIYELLVVDEKTRTLIHKQASEQEIEQHARQRTGSIRDDGRRLVLDGITTLEEVLRVTRED